MKLSLFSLILFSFALAADMQPQTLPFNFSLYMLAQLDSTPVPCADIVRQDPDAQWLCAAYAGGYEAFREIWETHVASSIIQDTYELSLAQGWEASVNRDGSLNGYISLYSFHGGILRVAFTPSQVGREIAIVFQEFQLPARPATTPAPATPAATRAPAPGVVGDCVDLNSATFENLRRIVHIDAERAQEIMILRPFSSLDAITRVRGIGNARLRDIRAEGLACVR